jgi:hypothetical protein
VRAPSKIPSDLIVWSAARDWRRKVEQLVAEYLTAAVKRRLRRMDPDKFYCDDLSWLDEATEWVPFQTPVQLELPARLLTYRVRTFHACRPRDIRTYLRHGLRKLRLGEASRQLRRLIARHERLAALRDESALQTALARIEDSGREGWLYVGLDDRPLVEDAGHYLIYGSEYFAAVLAQAGGWWFQEVLKTEGVPTVLVVDLPLKLASDSDVEAFSNLLLVEWAKGTVRRRWAAPWEDFSFSLAADLPPDYLTDHYDPARIRDPLHHFCEYSAPSTTCAGCAKSPPTRTSGRTPQRSG